MKEPTAKDIREAVNYANFLRGLETLSPEQRAIADLGHEIGTLRDWIRGEQDRGNICTSDILRGEICEGCRCGKADRLRKDSQ